MRGAPRLREGCGLAQQRAERLGAPPRKCCIQVIWRVRDHPPSPIDLWLQGMTACFLVSSVLFMSTGKCASISLCVYVAGSGEKAGHQDKDVSASDSPLCSATVQTATKCIHLGCHSGLTTWAPHGPRSSLEYGVDAVCCRPKKSHFLFQPLSFLLTETDLFREQVE